MYKKALENHKDFDFTESEGEEYDIDGKETLSDIEERVDGEADDLDRINGPSYYKKATLW